ncbi:hypothetical protein Plhal304r1_c013g0049381 [Plasmopara halstedii]
MLFKLLGTSFHRDWDSAERHAGIAYHCANKIERLEHVLHRLPNVEGHRALLGQILAVE